MKKTISATIIALSGATSALALWAPAPVASKTYCLDYWDVQNEDVGTPAYRAATCDQSNNNSILGRTLLSNGCAEGQMALTTHRYYNGAEEGSEGSEEAFPIQIGSCMPPNVTQL